MHWIEIGEHMKAGEYWILMQFSNPFQAGNISLSTYGQSKVLIQEDESRKYDFETVKK